MIEGMKSYERHTEAVSPTRQAGSCDVTCDSFVEYENMMSTLLRPVLELRISSDI